MGRTSKKIYILIVIFTTLIVLPLSRAQEQAVGHIIGFKLPEYNKDTGKLDFILYGDKAVKMGIKVNMDGVLLDLIQEEIKDPSKIKDLSKLKLYPINSKIDEVAEFWKTHKKSKMLLSTPTAIYNEVTKVIKGDDVIHLRAPSIDIDGVGFDADQTSQIIIIRTNVKVILRTDLVTATEQAKTEQNIKNGSKKNDGKKENEKNHGNK